MESASLMRRCAALVVTALLLAPMTVRARDQIVLGRGVSSCSTWTKEHSIGSFRANEQDSWLFGFITSINMFAPAEWPDVNAGMDNQALIAWMDNYCRANPLRPIVTAANMLVEELKKRAGVR
jgi:hypothetical protein